MAIKQTLIYIILLTSFVANCFVMNLNRTINFESNLGHVAVYDEAMPEWLSSTLSQFFQPGNRWTYQYPDELLGVSAREKGNFQWVAPISPRFFMQSKPWIVIATLMKNFTGENGYMAYHVMGTKIRRGFFPTPVPGTNSSDVYIRIFLTGSEEMKGLSEMVFFDENNEIIRAVQPKFNRVVVWNGSLTYMTKPVDYDNFNLEHSLWIRLSKDPQKYKNEMEYIMNLREEEAKRLLKPFPFKNVTMPPFSKDYYDAHCTRKFYNRHGSVIGVFDNLLTEEELVHLTKYVASHKSGYSSSDYMTTETDDADNVNWITMFEPEDINLSKMLRVVKNVAFYLSGEDDWHPYDVALNMVQNTFHTRIHEDCEPYEYEYTFLLYLNPNWTENMYGETIFLDKIQDMILDENDTIIQDKEYETIMAVRPKYGRIAMFRNNISHSARPPSPDFHGTRYTFAVKVSKNKNIALMKSLKEVLEFKAESDDTEAKALSTSVLEMLASQHFTMTLPEMKGNLTKYRNERKASMDKDNMSLQTTILRKAYVGKDQPSV